MSIDITSRWKQKDKYQCSKSTLYLDVCCIHLFAWRHTNLYSEPYGVSSGLIYSTDQSAMSLPSLWVSKESTR